MCPLVSLVEPSLFGIFIVLDQDNHPVKMYPVLPATISSAVEGWELEAWFRLDKRLSLKSGASYIG